MYNSKAHDHDSTSPTSAAYAECYTGRASAWSLIAPGLGPWRNIPCFSLTPRPSQQFLSGGCTLARCVYVNLFASYAYASGPATCLSFERIVELVSLAMLRPCVEVCLHPHLNVKKYGFACRLSRFLSNKTVKDFCVWSAFATKRSCGGRAAFNRHYGREYLWAMDKFTMSSSQLVLSLVLLVYKRNHSKWSLLWCSVIFIRNRRHKQRFCSCFDVHSVQ